MRGGRFMTQGEVCSPHRGRAHVVLSVKANRWPGPERPGGEVTQGGGGLHLGWCVKPYSRILCAAFCTVTSAAVFHLF